MAADIEPFRAKLATEFASRWTAAGAPFPVEFENQPESIDKTGAFGRYNLLLSSRSAAAIGAAHLRLVGTIALQVFVPREAGTKTAISGFDALAECFDYKTITVTLTGGRTGYVIFRAVYQAAILLRDASNPAHMQNNFWAPFTYDSSL